MPEDIQQRPPGSEQAMRHRPDHGEESYRGSGRPLRIVGTGLPALGGHRLVVVPKERATDARFPRRPGEPGRRPLG